MMLHRTAREFYTLEVTTDPAVAGWEASFDKGATWVAGTAGTLGDAVVFRWLVAGSAAELGTAVAVLTRSVAPLIRATDNPEVVVRSAPRIIVQ